MSYFFETLKLSTKKITSDFEATKQIWHNASVGMIREKLIKDILLPYLPDCYGVTAGLCYDKSESKSKQLDLIIYDKLFSYRLPFDNDFIVFPCESVYGNIEIKTNLNKETLQQAFDNISSLKSLSRKDATEFDITPHLELTLGGQHFGTKKNDMFGIVFAYESISIEAFMNDLSEIVVPSNIKHFPDVFVLLDKQTIIFRADLEEAGLAIKLTGTANGYVPIYTGEYTLAYFILYLLTVLYHSHLKSMNPGTVLLEEIMNSTSNKIDIKNMIRI